MEGELLLVKFTYNPTEKQKDLICLMQGYLGVEIMTLLGVLYL
jgi:hypothetical protein